MPTTLRGTKALAASDLDGLFRSGGPGVAVVAYQPEEILFSQGDPAESVIFLREGTVKLSVVSDRGQEAIVAIFETGAFFGEGALVGDPVRRETATAMTTATGVSIAKEQMMGLIHGRDDVFARFTTHLLTRNIRLEEDLVDQLFNSSEKRLARVLLLLAHADRPGKVHRVPLKLSQQALAEMVGTTRSRVNFFLTKFKNRGYIDYGDGLRVNDSLRTNVLADEPVHRRLPKTA